VSLYTTGLAKAKGATAYFVDESAQKGYRGANCYILAPRCGSSTVEEGRNSPYRLHDMMMMMMTFKYNVSFFIDIFFRMPCDGIRYILHNGEQISKHYICQEYTLKLTFYSQNSFI